MFSCLLCTSVLLILVVFQGYGRAFKLVLEAIPDAIPISIVAGAPRFVDELFVPGYSKGCSYDEFRPDPGIREMISSSRRRCSSTAAVGVAKRPRIGQSGQESSGNIIIGEFALCLVLLSLSLLS